MDIEHGHDSEEPLLGNGATDIIKPRGCMRATTVVGKIANFIRVLVALGLLAATITLGLIAGGVIPPNSIGGPSMAFSIIVAIGCAMVFFDASTAQFLVQVVLTRLSQEVDRLHGIAIDLRRTTKRLQGEVDNFSKNNEEFRKSLEKREKQLENAKKQISEQEDIISDLQVVQANAQNLLQSLIKFGNKTENFDKILTEHMDNLGNTAKVMEALTDRMTDQYFEQMDEDGDGEIDADEYRRWLERRAGQK